MLEVGKAYAVNHSRKGKFVMLVTDVDDVWVTGPVLEGRPKFISTAALLGDWGRKGADITVRRSLATFEPVPELDKPPAV